MITIIVPTMGRSSLGRLLDTIPSGRDGLEVLVVADLQHDVRHVAADVARRGFTYLEHHGGLYGAPQRDRGVAHASRGSYLVHMDDQDRLHPDALTNLEETVAALDEPRPLLCQVEIRGTSVMDHHVKLELGCVDGHQLIVPNLPGKVGAWGTGDWKADWTYIESTLALWPPDTVVRVPYLVAHAG